MLEECLKDKKDLVNIMSKNFIDIVKFSEKAGKLIVKRKTLRKYLLKSCKLNPDSIVLKE